MLGLAILFFLGLWVVITILAMFIGWKSTKRWGVKAGLFGAFLGFMLTMGGFIVYWTVEYYKIQSYVTHLCETEGGITVYVTPEEWRKQIGEEEWAELFPFTNQEMRDNGSPKIIEINHQNRIYEYTPGIFDAGNIENRRLALYDYYFTKENNITMSSYVIADKNYGDIFLEQTYFFHSVPAIAENLLGLKFWLENIKDCNLYNHQFYSLAKKYSNLTQEETNEK